jgi:hypothetical protein
MIFFFADLARNMEDFFFRNRMTSRRMCLLTRTFDEDVIYLKQVYRPED